MDPLEGKVQDDTLAPRFRNHNNLNNKDIKTSIDSDADRLKGDSKLNVYTDTEISPAKKKSSFQVVQEINLPYYLQEFDV